MNLNLFTKILVVIFALSASFSIYEIKAPEQDLLRTPLLAEGMEIPSAAPTVPAATTPNIAPITITAEIPATITPVTEVIAPLATSAAESIAPIAASTTETLAPAAPVINIAKKSIMPITTTAPTEATISAINIAQESISPLTAAAQKLSAQDWESYYEGHHEIMQTGAAQSTFEKISENLKNPYVLASLAAAGALASYGAYRYHQAYLSPTKELINESIKFIEELKEDNYAPMRNYYEQGKSDVAELFKNLDQKKSDILRALGLKSYLNPSANRYLNDLAQKESSDIEELFKTINFNYKQASPTSIPKENISGIDTTVNQIYVSLLQAKNGYEPKTLPNILSKICENNGYQIPKILFEPKGFIARNLSYTELKQKLTNPKLLIHQRSNAKFNAYDIYEKLIGIINEPKAYVLQEDATTQDIQNIQQIIKNEKIETLAKLGLYEDLYTKAITYIPGFRFTEQEKLERAEFEKLYDYLLESVTLEFIMGPNITQEADFQKIVKVAQKCCYLLISAALDDQQKWNIVRDYVSNQNESFKIQELGTPTTTIIPTTRTSRVPLLPLPVGIRTKPSTTPPPPAVVPLKSAMKKKVTKVTFAQEPEIRTFPTEEEEFEEE